LYLSQEPEPSIGKISRLVFGQKICGEYDLVSECLSFGVGGGPKLKVLDPVVRFDAIPVVDDLTIKKGTAEILSHQESVLSD